eukprot:RCo035550
MKSKRCVGDGWTVDLAQLIGHTVTSAAQLDCTSVESGPAEVMGYAAGCHAVVVDPWSQQQRAMLRARPGHCVSCLSFSAEAGKFLAVGEAGALPGICVWQWESATSVVKLKSGHKASVHQLCWCPSMKYLLSLGHPTEDGHLKVWLWKRSSTVLVASTKTPRVNGVAFGGGGSYFVTAGAHSVKFWPTQELDKLAEKVAFACVLFLYKCHTVVSR